MRHLLVAFSILITSFLHAQQNQSWNIDLLGTWTDETIEPSSSGSIFSSCWGYEADGREYAILGATHGTYIVDVTDPSNIVESAFVQSPIKRAIWREYKTYKNYLYAVSDDSRNNPSNVFQIIDLSGLPNSVKVVYEGSQEYFKQGHTIFIDGDKMYIGIRRAIDRTYSMTVYDLSENPAQPKFLRNIDDDFPDLDQTHDMFVRNDTVFASCGYSGLFMFHFDGNNFKELGSYVNYPFSGYNHSSILTPDGKTLIFTDEVPGNLPAKVLDLTDISNPVLIDTFYSQSGKATLHNPFLAPATDRFVMSSYQDGVQVYDYSNPSNIKLTGYFDTYYQADNGNTTGGYEGAWSAYPNLPSKNLIVLDMFNGLYMLDPTKAYSTTSDISTPMQSVEVNSYPNPATDFIVFNLPFSVSEGNTQIFDVSGRLVNDQFVKLNEGELYLSIKQLQPGTYTLRFNAASKVFTSKFIKQ